MADATHALRGQGLPPPQRLQTRAGALQYTLSGSGTPAIVLLNGAGVTLEGWRSLYPAIESVSTVFAWNRFGMKGSDAPSMPQSGAVVIASLRELLSYAGLAPPYVLVGHSLGGLYAQLFARLHPNEVAGVLFLESSHPLDHAAAAANESQLGRALEKVLSLPQRLFRENLHSEIEAVSHVAREIESAGEFPEIPVTVITGGTRPPKWLLSGRGLLARRAHQEELARLSPFGRQVVAQRSGHFPQVSEPAIVIGELARLLQDVRSRA